MKMKTRVHNTSTSREEMIKSTYYTQQSRQFVSSEETRDDESDSSSEELYDRTSSGVIIVKPEFTTEECIPDDGLDLYEEQTVESSYSGLTDYNILKDLVAQSAKNEGEILIHSEYRNVEGKIHQHEGSLVKHEYDEIDPDEYEVDDQIHPMAYEEHDDIETQEEQKLNCEKCPLKFETQNDLQNHKKIHNDKPFSCQICSKKFKKEMGMKVHITLKHGRQDSKMLFKFGTGSKALTTSKLPGKTILKIDETNNNGQRYDCKDCRRHFMLPTHLKNHLKSHNQRKSKPYECEICFKCFTQRGTLDTHKKIHLGHKPFKCHLCTRAFFQKGNLVTHLKIHAQNEKNFKVKFKKNKQPKFVKPEPSFSTRIKSEIHPAQSDLSVKKFSCEICSKSFLQLTNLHTHMRTHTGTRPFSCSYCSKSFTQVGNLQKHLKIHTGERPFKCEVCSKTFVQKCQMQKHMGVHSNDQNVKPARKQSVPRIKVFQCKNCSKKYKQNVNLKKHMEKCISPTQHIPTESNAKQIHFERISNVKVEDESEYLSDSSDNASVSGNASTDSSNNSDSSEFGYTDYDNVKNDNEF